MRRTIVLISGLAMAGISAFALPAACNTGTYTSYVALGSTGCTDGDATFSNFSGLNFQNFGISGLTTDEIQVIPGGTLLAPTLTFLYLNATGAPTPVTVNVNGQQFAMGFNYLMTLSGAVLRDIQMDSVFNNTTPGSVSATKGAQLQTGGTVFTSTVNDQGANNASANHVGNVVPTSGTGVWVITDGVSLQAQSGGVATQTSFENLFILDQITTNTPETATMLMMGTGLIGLSLLSRRRRGSRHVEFRELNLKS
ncbi:MAG TPA: hypothetical protein VNX18_23385 [Bryobacteraceae bacterium]|jgi:hypothetical protein|nr:hypothetical protein [Bryobacteraceae bacterium]